MVFFDEDDNVHTGDDQFEEDISGIQQENFGRADAFMTDDLFTLGQDNYGTLQKLMMPDLGTRFGELEQMASIDRNDNNVATVSTIDHENVTNYHIQQHQSQGPTPLRSPDLQAAKQQREPQLSVQPAFLASHSDDLHRNYASGDGFASRSNADSLDLTAMPSSANEDAFSYEFATSQGFGNFAQTYGMPQAEFQPTKILHPVWRSLSRVSSQFEFGQPYGMPAPISQNVNTVGGRPSNFPRDGLEVSIAQASEKTTSSRKRSSKVGPTPVARTSRDKTIVKTPTNFAEDGLTVADQQRREPATLKRKSSAEVGAASAAKKSRKSSVMAMDDDAKPRPNLASGLGAVTRRRLVKPFIDSAKVLEAVTASHNAMVELADGPQYPDKLKTVQAARDQLDRVVSGLNYHKVIDKKDDDLEFATPQVMEHLSQLLFQAITQPEQAAPAHLSQEDQDHINRQHRVKYQAVLNKMCRQEQYDDVEARIVILIDTVKKIHTDGIAMPQLKLNLLTRDEIDNDDFPHSKAKTVGNYLVEHEWSFVNRLLRIIEHVRNDKYVAQDLIEGHRLFDLACAPDGYQRQKFNNSKANKAKRVIMAAGKEIKKKGKGGKAEPVGQEAGY